VQENTPQRAGPAEVGADRACERSDGDDRRHHENERAYDRSPDARPQAGVAGPASGRGPEMVCRHLRYII
jgi:hypothetical protein